MSLVIWAGGGLQWLESALNSTEAYGIQFHAIQNRFLCSEYSASVCCPLPWDFAVWQADVVATRSRICFRRAQSLAGLLLKLVL